MSQHFIVYYPPSEKESWADEILRYAENYYDKLAREIGYSRYDKYWTWDNRVKLFLYPDQETFQRETGQPPWSRGITLRDDKIIQSGVIATYKQEDDFSTSVLPHEICHLMLRDFLGSVNVPLWFNEGLAQLEENGKKEKARAYLRGLLSRPATNTTMADRGGQHENIIPLQDLFDTETIVGKDEQFIAKFYGESIALLDFLMTEYGENMFSNFCYHLKNGKSSDAALLSAYGSMFSSISELQEKWVRYFQH